MIFELNFENHSIPQGSIQENPIPAQSNSEWTMLEIKFSAMGHDYVRKAYIHNTNGKRKNNIAGNNNNNNNGTSTRVKDCIDKKQNKKKLKVGIESMTHQ